MNMTRVWIAKTIPAVWTYAIKWLVIGLLSLPILSLMSCGGGGGGTPAPGGGGQSATDVEALAVALNSVRTLIAGSNVGLSSFNSVNQDEKPCEVSGTSEENGIVLTLKNCVNDAAPSVTMNGSANGNNLTTLGGFTVSGSILGIDSLYSLNNGLLVDDSIEAPAVGGYELDTKVENAFVRLGAVSNYEHVNTRFTAFQRGAGTDATFERIVVGATRIVYKEQVLLLDTVAGLTWGTAAGGGPSQGTLEIVPLGQGIAAVAYTFASDGSITYETTSGITQSGTVAWADVRAAMVEASQ